MKGSQNEIVHFPRYDEPTIDQIHFDNYFTSDLDRLDQSTRLFPNSLIADGAKLSSLLGRHCTTFTEAESSSRQLPLWPGEVDGCLLNVNSYQEQLQHWLADAAYRFGNASTFDAPNSPSYADAHLDEDTLDVDDQRRHYDVAEFLTGRWSHEILREAYLHQQSISSSFATEAGTDSDRLSMPSSRSNTSHLREIRKARVDLHPSRRSSRVPRLNRRPWGQKDDAPRTYQFENSTSAHKARFSHYQLRNLIAAHDQADMLYANNDCVYRASLACPSYQSSPVLDLSRPVDNQSTFRITCLTTSNQGALTGSGCSDSVLLVGGFEGQYALVDLAGSLHTPHVEGTVSHDYDGLVNHAHLYPTRQSGLLQAAICANNHQVRLLDTRTQKFTATFSYATSINCAATSPDGRLRVLVGDTADVYITNAERGETLVALPGKHMDDVFACDWSASGTHVATAAQDGTTLLWDARNWSKPLHSLASIMSCVRSVHFTQTGLLVAAENEDVVSIYDPKSTAPETACQDLWFLGCIAGVSLVDGGDRIVVANADRTVGGLLTLRKSTSSDIWDQDDMVV